MLAKYLSMWKKGVFHCFFEIHSIKGELDQRDLSRRELKLCYWEQSLSIYLFLSGLGTNRGHTYWWTSSAAGREELGNSRNLFEFCR